MMPGQEDQGRPEMQESYAVPEVGPTAQESGPNHPLQLRAIQPKIHPNVHAWCQFGTNKQRMKLNFSMEEILAPISTPMPDSKGETENSSEGYFPLSCKHSMEPAIRLELMTPALRERCSTN